MALLLGVYLRAEPIPVRHPEGSARGFLALKTLDGTRISTGDMTQIVHGNRVISRLIFRFQRGPSFPKPIDVFLDARSWQITSRTKDGSTLGGITSTY